jgi:hypothetical protein
MGAGTEGRVDARARGAVPPRATPPPRAVPRTTHPRPSGMAVGCAAIIFGSPARPPARPPNATIEFSHASFTVQLVKTGVRHLPMAELRVRRPGKETR